MTKFTAAPQSTDPFRNVLRATLALLVVLRGGGVFAAYQLSGRLLNLQDRWLLLLQLVLGGAALLLPGRWPGGGRLALTPRRVALIMLALLLACYAGHYWLLAGYDLSRDEQMAVFDARIFASGRLVWPLPPTLRADAPALNLLFMPAVEHPVAWASTYLPMNSALRAVLSLLVDPALAGPLYTAGSAGLVWAIARKLWPDDGEAPVVALAVMALSGQAVFAGMTAYAMPAHLFFNLLWLWLFLRDRPAADALALLVGFIATGLHQPLFHPLFAAPFLALLAWRRQGWRLATYSAAYALITGFWLLWPHHVFALVGGPAQHGPEGLGMIIARLRETIAQNILPLPLMASNLLRFSTWQAVMTLPLLLAGLWAARRDPLGLALGAGVLMPILVLMALLAYQGHGFGYRYLHGMIGNVALLGVYGWRWLIARADDGGERLRCLFRRAAVLSALVLLPVQAAMAHAFYAPFAAARARISASGADYVVIGGDDGLYAADLVLNRPDLANRPIRLLDDEIDDPDALAARICRGTRVVTVAMPDDHFFDAMNDYFGVPHTHSTSARYASDGDSYRNAGCRVVRI